MTAASPTISKPPGASLTEALRAATPALLFGLRLWASVCLSLYVAFALELSEPSWAATTAALVCQPVLGASLRKSMFRLVGTMVGAVAIVVLAAFVRQDRAGFLIGLGDLVRGLRVRRDTVAQFRRLCRGARRLYGGDYRDRHARPGRNHERPRLHLRRRSLHRDLHRHRLRGNRARPDGSGPLAAKARDGIRHPVDGDHGWVRRLFRGRRRQSSNSTKPAGASSCAASSHSIRSSIPRSGKRPICAIARRPCNGP